ncbi:MAG: elongation factor Ts [Sedimentisphaerales bacterium]|nr:elongation factor Ts [Sedimentisphaerales bacterium]
MAEISAALVMKLRKMSGQGMMDCKKALAETDGDLDKAMELLRKKGLATMEKRAGRDTTEGRVVCSKSQDGKTAAMATLCCETDFVSKSDDFVALAEKMGRCLPACQAESGADAVLTTSVDGKPFSEHITDTVSKTGEKTEVGDYARFTLPGTGVIATYVHFNNKLGVMVEIECSSDTVSKAVLSVGNDIAMHVTAMNPVAVDKDGVGADVLEKERVIAREQVKNKPANIVDKIVDGKIAKFLKDNCLVEQAFVKDDSKTVGQALNEAAKAGGGQAKIKRFVRFEIG